MLKKYFAAALLSCAFLAPAYAAPAQDSEMDSAKVVATLPDGQVAVEGDWENSGENDIVEESPIAQKMTQAEKAKNAQENDSWGGAITIIAMSIVILALVILSILFYGFGKISTFFLSKKKMEAKGAANHDDDHPHDEVDSGEVIAAISAALAEHFSGKHDVEDTVLTIRRLRKAYSPWNSKIYTLRDYPATPSSPVRDNALRRSPNK